jgi:hypothetical protein
MEGFRNKERPLVKYHPAFGDKVWIALHKSFAPLRVDFPHVLEAFEEFERVN